MATTQPQGLLTVQQILDAMARRDPEQEKAEVPPALLEETLTEAAARRGYFGSPTRRFSSLPAQRTGRFRVADT